MKNIFKRKEKNQNSKYLQLIVNCKSETDKQLLLQSLIDDERVSSIQLGEGGTVVHVGSFVGTYLKNNTTGSNNNMVGTIK